MSHFIESLEPRQFLSSAPAASDWSEATNPTSIRAAAAATVQPKLASVYVGELQIDKGWDRMVLRITSQDLSADGQSRKLVGTLEQLGAGITVKFTGTAQGTAITGRWKGATTGSAQGSIGPASAFLVGDFTSLQAGKTHKGTFTVRKPDAKLQKVVKGTYKGKLLLGYQQSTPATLRITQQSGIGVIRGTITIPQEGRSFDFAGTVDWKDRTLWILFSDGKSGGRANGTFRKDWSGVSGYYFGAIDGHSRSASYVVKRA